MTSPHPSITLRQPSTSSTPSPSSVPPPSLAWLSGSWNVTHSTLPMWKKSRNVRITYTALATRTQGVLDLDDVVTYQPLDKSKKKMSRVRGVDKASSTLTSTSTSASASASASASTAPTATASAEGTAEADNSSLTYTWRGRGLLMIATSKWEILGYGTEGSTGNEWVVTYFAKTLFTPAGVDFYSRRGKLQDETVEGITRALEGLGGGVAELAGGLFEVAYDGEREGDA
ncbi:uncharacterized protein EKO05_0001259 [Ascochyta rabiei]|uniref:Uncharacterized protein n=1 Tax=Didymella rabiei TaxID=5454 RepID=A0A163D3N3_DIDRA|nr:uncharacterized protein EKO05_0001259 [Ascochyta rabiei]KZM22885.1 hypothetical protein ST47_g5958 [Ascochyta rabiei]UPX10611.1 hypothetical protein EKO05_0001259 [Ascochyta rabiei]